MSSKIRWVIIMMVFVATGLSFLDRQVLSMTIIKIQKEFNLSDVQYGWINTSFLISYALMFTIAGRLIDKYGGRLGLALSVGIWSVANSLHGIMSTFAHLITLRFLLGMGEGGAFPGAAKIVNEWFSSKERALANGIAIGGSAIGAVIAPPLTSYIALNYGWRMSFAVPGIIGVLWVAIWLLLPSKNHASNIENGEQQIIVEKPSLWSIMQQKQVWIFIAIRFMLDPVFYFIMFWIPKFLNQERHLSFEKIGQLFWIPFLALGISNILGGWLSDKLIKHNGSLNKSRKLVMGVAAVLTMVAPVIAFSHSAELAILLISIMLFAHGFWITNYITTIADIFGTESTSTIVGLSGTAGAISGLLINPLIGIVIKSYSYTPVWIISGLMYPLAFIVLMVFIPKIRPLRQITLLAVSGVKDT
jgi:ACS family hexuronate transporter-like MFS transporter